MLPLDYVRLEPVGDGGLADLKPLYRFPCNLVQVVNQLSGLGLGLLVQNLNI